MVSGRVSFGSCRRRGSAAFPSSWRFRPRPAAVELATEAGITLLGFVRGKSLNIYARIPREHV
jgi:FdhD protein